MTLVLGSELRQNLLVTLYSFCEVCAHSELSASAAEIRATSPLSFNGVQILFSYGIWSISVSRLTCCFFVRSRK